MSGWGGPWYVAGGWAIDLYLDRVTRTHHDIEIAVFREDQVGIQSFLSDWEFLKVIPDEYHLREKWLPGEYLSPPIHEIHASCSNHDPSALEILLNERDGNHWIFRRNPGVRSHLSKIGLHSKDGIPFLCPEIVLLYKAKKPKHIDEVDFFHTYQVLNEESCRWLAEAIRSCYPGHPWLLLLPDKKNE